jgi:EAL domain-containing protein (putative c-di-GMP-specific phosphodiesterase class I)
MDTLTMSNCAPDAIRDNDLMDYESRLYGPVYAAALTSLAESLRRNACDIVNWFYEGLTHLPRTKLILETLSELELRHLKSQQIQNVYALAAPDLTAKDHRTMALRAGRIHAILGLEQEDLIRARGLLSAAIHCNVDTNVHGEALAVLGRRINRDLAWQTEAWEQLQTSRQNVLRSITRLTWDAGSYTDLIVQVGEILGTLEEVAGCSVGRLDSEGVFLFEAVSGGTMEAYRAELDSSAARPVSNGDHPLGRGPAGRAWRSGKAERTVNFQTDPLAKPWKDLARRKGFRSSVAIPLSPLGYPPMAILSLYSAFPGGYAAPEQISFIGQLQTLLGFAIARIENREGPSDTVPYATRQHWAALLRSDALQMHYQPLLDLRTGQIGKVEALARLRDGDRLLAPGEFFPALSSNDFLVLYVRGLGQTLAQRNRWLQDGVNLNVSINLPPSALSDIRYFEATQKALTEHGCAPHMLTLEILETDALPSGMDLSLELAKFKALGVILAEDDLGSGHSSLNRLRSLPFDWVKIDRGIVSHVDQDPSNVLHFIYHLTRLGHSLGKSVIVEGVEGAELLEAIVILGADAAQGYGIARPMPAQQMIAWLGNQPRLPDPHNPKSPLGKLAQLLIWEESRHLISQKPAALNRLPRHSRRPALNARPDVK